MLEISHTLEVNLRCSPGVSGQGLNSSMNLHSIWVESLVPELELPRIGSEQLVEG